MEVCSLRRLDALDVSMIDGSSMIVLISCWTVVIVVAARDFSAI